MDIQSVNNQNLNSGFTELQSQISSSDSATAALNQQLSQLQDALNATANPEQGNSNKSNFINNVHTDVHNIIRNIHETSNLGLKEAKDLIDNAPKSVDKSDAQSLENQFHQMS